MVIWLHLLINRTIITVACLLTSKLHDVHLMLVSIRSACEFSVQNKFHFALVTWCSPNNNPAFRFGLWMATEYNGTTQRPRQRRFEKNKPSFCWITGFLCYNQCEYWRWLCVGVEVVPSVKGHLPSSVRHINELVWLLQYFFVKCAMPTFLISPYYTMQKSSLQHKENLLECGAR